ncbi:MAG: hypothetical protein ABIV48_07570 [Pyrinomonadaceae bacterium]
MIGSDRGEKEVPSALRMWFVIHFAADMITALPLFIAPREVLGLLGWIEIDPFAARLTAAALFGIGLESLLGRNAGRESFNGMLQLKLIWSAFAAIGLAWSTLEGNLTYPLVGWALFAVFAAFHLLWWYWLLRLKKN